MSKESGSAIQVVGMSTAHEAALAAFSGGSSFAKAAQGRCKSNPVRFLQ